MSSSLTSTQLNINSNAVRCGTSGVMMVVSNDLIEDKELAVNEVIPSLKLNEVRRCIYNMIHESFDEGSAKLPASGVYDLLYSNSRPSPGRYVSLSTGYLGVSGGSNLVSTGNNTTDGSTSWYDISFTGYIIRVS